jgi:hypothetical protein
VYLLWQTKGLLFCFDRSLGCCTSPGEDTNRTRTACVATVCPTQRVLFTQYLGNKIQFKSRKSVLPLLADSGSRSDDLDIVSSVATEVYKTAGITNIRAVADSAGLK